MEILKAYFYEKYINSNKSEFYRFKFISKKKIIVLKFLIFEILKNSVLCKKDNYHFKNLIAILYTLIIYDLVFHPS